MTIVSDHPAFWLLVAAVVAPLLAEIPLGFKLPVIVLEVVFGIPLGPHGLGSVQFDGLVDVMFTLGMAATLFMAGMELEWAPDPRPPADAGAGRLGRLAAPGVAVVGSCTSCRSSTPR